MNKAIKRQLARTAGGQDLWPRKSVAHQLREPAYLELVNYCPKWAREYIARRLGNALATPLGKLP